MAASDPDGGISALQRRIAAIPQQIRQDIQTSLERSGDELVDAMVKLAPKKTGALAASIKMTKAGETAPVRSLSTGAGGVVLDNAVVVTAGDKEAFYAAWVEHGTVKTEAEPFFFPAFRALRNRIKRRTQRDTLASIRRYWSETSDD